MAHTKQDLVDSIKRMKDVVSDPDASQSTKDLIKPNLEKAEKLLAELEASEKPKEAATPAHTPTAKEIVRAVQAGKKEVEKAHVSKTKVKVAPMTKKQKQTLREIVASSKKYAAYAGKSEAELRRDASRKAKRPGKRISKTGHEYREYRANRSDVNAGAPHLVKGGVVNLSLIRFKVNTIEAHNGKFHYSVYKYGDNEYVTSVLKTGWPESFNNKVFKDQKSAVLFSERQARKYAAGGAIGEGKNGYIAFYKGKQLEVMADSSYAAQQKAAAHFKAKKSYDVTVVLAEKEGEQVTHVPDFAAGGALHFGQLKPLVNAKGGEVDRAGQLQAIVNARGGTIEGTQLDIYGYQTRHLTEDGMFAFQKAMRLLDEDQNEISYAGRKRAMHELAATVDIVLSIKRDSDSVHGYLQDIGRLNYQTGMALQTDWLNETLAARHLEDGGEIDDYGGRGFNQYGEPYGFDSGDEPDYETDAFITDVVRGGYDVSADGRYLDHFDDFDDALEFIREWSEKNQYYPNLWSVSDHGNASLINYQGEQLKKGGRLKSAINRDRKYQSSEPWEQSYQRKSKPRHPKYKLAKGGRIKNIAPGTKVTIDATRLNLQLKKAKSRKVEDYLKELGKISNEIGVFKEREGYGKGIVKFESKTLTVPMDLLLPLSFAKGGQPKPLVNKKGGVTFAQKVKAISGNLEGQPVAPKYRGRYGSRYSRKEAIKAAKNIAGAMKRKENK